MDVVFETQGQLWCTAGSLEVVGADWVQTHREGSTWWLGELSFYGLTNLTYIWLALIYFFSKIMGGFSYNQNPSLPCRNHNKYAKFYFSGYLNFFFLTAEDYDFTP